jgi:hypothetical protein
LLWELKRHSLILGVELATRRPARSPTIIGQPRKRGGTSAGREKCRAIEENS